MVTGSGGLSVSKWFDIPFIQEVVACTNTIKKFATNTDVAIELGGEDAKITFFDDGIDQRMNGTCAGGYWCLYRSNGISSTNGCKGTKPACKKL